MPPRRCFDYLPANAVIVHDAALPRTARARLGATSSARYEERRHDIERPMLPPAELFLTPRSSAPRWRASPAITLDAFKADTELTGVAAGGAQLSDHRAAASCASMCAPSSRFAPLDAFLKDFDGRVLIAADSAGRREVLQEMLRAYAHEVTRRAQLGSLRRGAGAAGTHRGAGPRGPDAHRPRRSR